MYAIICSSFEITGNYPAPDFFSIDATTGQLAISKNLEEDSLRSAEYKVLYDDVHFQFLNSQNHYILQCFELIFTHEKKKRKKSSLQR